MIFDRSSTAETGCGPNEQGGAALIAIPIAVVRALGLATAWFVYCRKARNVSRAGHAVVQEGWHMVTGLLRPTSGSIHICGIPSSTKESRRYLGFAPDDLPLPNALTGDEYLALHSRLRDRDSLRSSLGIAEALGLTEHLDRLIGEYPHGMKRKIQLVAALSHRPNLLVLDEPYRGLDPESSALLRSSLDAFTSKGASVVVATHDMLRAEIGCDTVAILHQGRVAAAGVPAELCLQFDVSTLEQVLLISTGVGQQQEQRAEALGDLIAPGPSTRQS